MTTDFSPTNRARQDKGPEHIFKKRRYRKNLKEILRQNAKPVIAIENGEDGFQRYIDGVYLVNKKYQRVKSGLLLNPTSV